MAIKRFTYLHLILFLLIAHIGGFRVQHIVTGTKEAMHTFVELYRGVGAIITLGWIRRQEIEVCLTSYGGYEPCFTNEKIKKFNKENGLHFEYDWKLKSMDRFKITATRTTFEGGDPENSIWMKFSSNKVKRRGSGLYWFVF